ncbi:hypothetical protein C8R44DRAFT_774075 [Mycena epipterygia]|nr:hypothetical protein C8R44DRAFT_774075 [Mycena epipterygia]
MPPARLAQELLDCIIDQVQDRKTLKPCSLVARSLAGSSQRRIFRAFCLATNAHIYSRILLEPHHRAMLFMTFEKALNLFTIAPHLGSFATDVHLGLIQPHDPNDTRCDDLSVVESILRMVPQLTVFGIFHNTSDSLHWSRFPASFASLLKHTALRPTIRSMRLERIRGVPSSLILVPPFRALALYYVTIEKDIKSTPPVNAAYFNNLDNLTIQLRSDCNEFVLETVMHHLAGLRKLSLVSTEDERCMRFLVEANFRQSLEHLELSFNPDINPIVMLELPPFRALKSLKIEFAGFTPVLPPRLKLVLDDIHTVAPLLQYLFPFVLLPFYLLINTAGV